MSGRKYSAGSSYRYGFNGKENDKDAGEGIQDYGMRIYDGRLGRFLSTDPLTKNYPMLTAYQFASNRPIVAIDLDGMEALDQSSRFRAMESDGVRLGINPTEHVLSLERKRALGNAIGLSFWFGGSSLLALTESAAITLISSQATFAYTTYSVAASNVGAFVVEVMNPDPNATPGFEFTYGDDVARGIKLLFKQTAVPLVKPIEKFLLNTSKLDYLFGKLEYQNLKGADLASYAEASNRVVKDLIHNQDRAASMAKVFDYWNIKDSKAGLGKLADLFDKALSGKIVSTKTNEYGTSITRELPLIFSEGARKGESAGTLQVSFFYKDSDLSAVPEVTSVIPIPDKKL